MQLRGSADWDRCGFNKPTSTSEVHEVHAVLGFWGEYVLLSERSAPNS